MTKFFQWPKLGKIQSSFQLISAHPFSSLHTGKSSVLLTSNILLPLSLTFIATQVPLRSSCFSNVFTTLCENIWMKVEKLKRAMEQRYLLRCVKFSKYRVIDVRKDIHSEKMYDFEMQRIIHSLISIDKQIE